MNLRHLTIFRSVRQTGSVTEAARLLGISQPAASRMLREAEEEFGRLFERRGGRLVPRSEAQLFADAVERVFLEMERVRLLAEELQGPISPRLRIGAIPNANMTLLPRALAAFRRIHADVKIDTFALPTQRIVEEIAVGALDLGLVFSPRDHAGVDAIELAEAELLCAMRADHPLAAAETVTARDLARHAFISYHLDEPISLAIREGLRAAGGACSPAVLVNHAFTSCALAEEGVGIAIVSQFVLASGRFPGLVWRPLRPAITLKAQLLHGRHRPLGPEAQALIGLLRTVVEAQMGDGRPSAAATDETGARRASGGIERSKTPMRTDRRLR